MSENPRYKAADREDMAARLSATIELMAGSGTISAEGVYAASQLIDEQKDDAVYMADLLLWKKWGLPGFAPPDKESDEKPCE